MIKTYSELVKLRTFKDRYLYLQLGGKVGQETFGFDRYLNQTLYLSREWKRCRDGIIIRDNGCDLGCEDFEIHGRIYVHHIATMKVEDILNRHPKIFDPENLISTSYNTHLAIHYGNAELLAQPPVEREKNDTCPWRR